MTNDHDSIQPSTAQRSTTGMLDALGPKRSFLAGVIVTVAVASFFGMAITVSMALTGDESGKVAGTTTNTTVPTQPAAAPQPTTISVPPVTDTDWVKGDRSAKVSIIEFSDTECPFCKRFHPTMQQILQEYDGQVNWVYRHFPLTSLHPKAPREAEATECAGELGGNEGFWAYLDRLFEVTPSNNGLADEQLPQIAEDVGLDRSAFSACLESGKYAGKVQEQTQQATAAGAQGTPFSVIVSGDQTVPISGALPYEQVKSAIESIL